MKKPNILYLHSHDTGPVHPALRAPGADAEHPAPGRPGAAVPQGVLRRADVLGQSRSALLTGQYPHINGMMGLAHRGFELFDYGHHIVHTLREAGYWSGLIGEQHLSQGPGGARLRPRGRDPTPTHVEYVAPAAVELIAAGARRSRSSSRSASSRPTASTSSRPRCATRCTRCRPTTCPTRPRRGATWPPTRRARARWTRASAPCSTRSTSTTSPTTRS